MKSWSIGEVARFLGVKPHVIRYWEGELPLLSPRKGLSGRREYTANEIRLLLRFRHLLYERKFTVEGAKRLLWEELAAGDPNIAARFAEIRADLIDALMTARGERSAGARADGGDGSDGSGRSNGSGREEMITKDLMERFCEAGQDHLFAHWAARPAQMKKLLQDDLASLDLFLLRQLRLRLEQEEGRGPSDSDAAPGAAPRAAAGAAPAPPAGFAPAPFVSLAESREDGQAREAGEECIRQGRTAFLTVAGGQGSRLGFDGPKGMFPITPVRKLSLFAWFAEKLLAARRWYGALIPWLIMTGPHNHAATEEYFRRKDWFGLGRDSVRFFMQGSLPSLSPEGRLLMGPEGGLLFNPNGHGGVVEALRASGTLEAMRQTGVEQLFYFQVDNPLVRVPDPTFLGVHCRGGSQISSKVIEKAYPEEKLGVIVTTGGKLSVIEYSDLDEAAMQARGSDGKLLFSQGSIAIHILDVAFLSNPDLQLPLHIARKKARLLNPTSEGAETIEGEAVKMEMFIFDAIPAAHRALFFETDRAEEFAPLKNKEGRDSIETCVRGQVEKAARWLERCGVEVPRDGDGRSLHAIEVSPLFASEPEVLAARRGVLKDRIDEDTLLV
jgi:UDP-N-acetylglucosamine/UDP-N-acetylgalactosamine diphosphorylase